MSMLQQSGSSTFDRQAKLDEWRRIWAPPAPVALRAPLTEKSISVVSAAPNERSAWTSFQMPTAANAVSTDDTDGSVNRVAAMRAYEETTA